MKVLIVGSGGREHSQRRVSECRGDTSVSSARAARARAALGNETIRAMRARASKR